mmetsp:Transcript_123324/g.245542  ORF Transcript_123324/g.245542 Transcript_123324/m.245542 type:complete len:257 (+) Transcript_123324:463-1233(+)
MESRESPRGGRSPRSSALRLRLRRRWAYGSSNSPVAPAPRYASATASSRGAPPGVGMPVTGGAAGFTCSPAFTSSSHRSRSSGVPMRTSTGCEPPNSPRRLSSFCTAVAAASNDVIDTNAHGSSKRLSGSALYKIDVTWPYFAHSARMSPPLVPLEIFPRKIHAFVPLSAVFSASASATSPGLSFPLSLLAMPRPNAALAAMLLAVAFALSDSVFSTSGLTIPSLGRGFSIVILIGSFFFSSGAAGSGGASGRGGS